MKYSVTIAPTALKMIKAISDRRIRKKLIECIDGLVYKPEKKGKPLWGELSNLRTIRAVGQRYRIIYCVKQKKIEVIVIAVGIRKEGEKVDIYRLLKRLVKNKLL